MFKVTIKTLERRHWRRSGPSFCSLWPYFPPCSSVFIVNFEQVNVSWVREWNITFIEICISKMHPKWNYQESTLPLLIVSSAKVYDSQDLKLKFSLWSLGSILASTAIFKLQGKINYRQKIKERETCLPKYQTCVDTFFKKCTLQLKFEAKNCYIFPQKNSIKCMRCTA